MGKKKETRQWIDELDRGPAKYFHGRKEELREWRKRLEHATVQNSGTIFVIQAPPGAGKTALVEECKKLADKDKWQTLKISEMALWNSNELRKLLGRKPDERVTGREQKAGPESHLVGTTGRMITVDSFPSTPLDILREGESPLLLILDEAQDMADALDLPVQDRQNVKRLLKEIHNGEMGRPLILLAAGLGMTSMVFKSLGASRIDGKSLVELGRMKREEERAVFVDWFEKEFEIKEGYDPWIDGILEETQGWPHHITSYIRACIDHIKQHSRTLTEKSRLSMMETGRELREAYYRKRAEGLAPEHYGSLTKTLRKNPSPKGLTQIQIIKALAAEYGQAESEKFFYDALDRGVLHEQAGFYTIPISSLFTWLEKNARSMVNMAPPERDNFL